MTEATPMVVEVDCSTGVTTERPMTEQEVADMQARAAAFAAEQAARDAEAAAKAEAKASALAKLTALGLTEAEAQAIAGA